MKFAPFQSVLCVCALSAFACSPVPSIEPEDAGIADSSTPDTGIRDAGRPSADAGLPLFSFFVTSLKTMQALSKNTKGFGGDLRYGETGPGAGLRGADKICAAVAERSMPGASTKRWRAFLSVSADESGKQIDAIDRIGSGPWYDRLGRYVATKPELLYDRPLNASAAIKNDLPNEYGVPNHNPDLLVNIDDHDILTGSDSLGRLYKRSDGVSTTCKDWTTSDGSATNGYPRVGHSWPTVGLGSTLTNWMSALDAAGCAADVYLVDDGPAKPGTHGVGSGGGYGGIYCFALQP